MAESREVKEMVAHRERGYFLFGLFLLTGALVLVLPSGCHPSASGGKTPATQASGNTAALAGASNPATSQGAKPVEVEVTMLLPKISVEEALYDFGDVGPETTQTAKFAFKNTGKGTLRISQVKTCCGVKARGVKNGQEYAPGKGGVLEFDCVFGSYPGPMRRTIHLYTNDPDQNVVALAIKAKIVRRVDYKPQRLRLFLRQENGGCGEIALTSLDGQPFSIAGFRSTANALTAEIDPAVKATEFVLKPKANMDTLKRNHRGQISIQLTHPECKNVRILYDVVPEFTVNPPQVMLFNLKAEQSVPREIWIISNYQDEFEIESTDSQKGMVKVVDQKKVGNRYQLKVEVTPPAREGERAVLSDVLEVKIKDGETLSIAFRGFY